MSRNAICKKKLFLELLPISFGTKNRQNLYFLRCSGDSLFYHSFFSFTLGAQFSALSVSSLCSDAVNHRTDMLINQCCNHRNYNSLNYVKRSHADKGKGPHIADCRVDRCACCNDILQRHKIGIERQHNQRISHNCRH